MATCRGEAPLRLPEATLLLLLAVKLTFRSQSLPKKILLFHQSFNVRIFVDKPWQCYNCQGFGHYAKDCRKDPVCVLCSNKHKSYDCPEREKQIKTLKCKNCHGNHAAYYNGCEKIKTAKEVEKLRAYNGISYREAVLASKTQNKVITTAPMTRQENRNDTQAHIQTEKVDASTQTMTADNPTNTTSLITQMSILIVKLLKMRSLEDSNEVINTIKSVTGITLSEGEIAPNQSEDCPPETETGDIVREDPPTTKLHTGKRKIDKPEQTAGAKSRKTEPGAPSQNLRSNTHGSPPNKKNRGKTKNLK